MARKRFAMHPPGAHADSKVALARAALLVVARHEAFCGARATIPRWDLRGA